MEIIKSKHDLHRQKHSTLTKGDFIPMHSMPLLTTKQDSITEIPKPQYTGIENVCQMSIGPGLPELVQ